MSILDSLQLLRKGIYGLDLLCDVFIDVGSGANGRAQSDNAFLPTNLDAFEEGVVWQVCSVVAPNMRFGPGNVQSTLPE